jgi:4-aminobutyrate aminotransferase
MLFVVDEVQSGIGRTGRMFAIEHAGVEPDIILAAKGIASGLPMGVTIARDDVMDWPVGAHSNTFGGNPVACAAALATIKLVEDGLMANAAEVGEFLLAKLNDLARRHQILGDIRGRGLMIGMELVRDRRTKEHAVAERDALVLAAFRRGLLVLAAGTSAIRLSPPLVVTTDQAQTAATILDDALADISNS